MPVTLAKDLEPWCCTNELAAMVIFIELQALYV